MRALYLDRALPNDVGLVSDLARDDDVAVFAPWLGDMVGWIKHCRALRLKVYAKIAGQIAQIV